MKKSLFLLFVLITAWGSYAIFKNPAYPSINSDEVIQAARLNLNENQEIITFSSKNPFNIRDILHRRDELAEQKVYGILTLPESKEKFPLIIGFAGSHGWADHHYEYLKRYLKMGIAVLSVHSFESRAVDSTVGEQVSVTMAMMIYDAYMALEYLTRDERIDAERIGVTGWSLGGGVALFTSWKPLQNTLTPETQFAVHLPIYPPCMVLPEIIEFTDAPVHILIGELDDWVPAEPCVVLVNKLKTMGFDFNITVYPDSHHSFDRRQEVILQPNAYNFTECRLTLSEDGVVRTNTLGFPLSTPILQKIGLAFCAERGARYGGNDAARVHAEEFAKTFMKTHLLQ